MFRIRKAHSPTRMHPKSSFTEKEIGWEGGRREGRWEGARDGIGGAAGEREGGWEGRGQEEGEWEVEGRGEIGWEREGRAGHGEGSGHGKGVGWED